MWINSTKLDLVQLFFILKIWCVECEACFIFKAPAGFSSEHAMTGEDGTLLRIPAFKPEERKEEDGPDDKEAGEEEPTLH